MNILVIPVFCGLSKPKSGVQNRISNLVKELKKHNNVIVLESKNFFNSTDCNLAKIYTYKENKIFNRELPATRDVNISFAFQLLKILKREKIDLIQTNHPSGIFLVKALMVLQNKKIPLVYDAHNVESLFVKDVISNNPLFSKFNRVTIPLYIALIEKISCKYIIDYITTVSHKEKDIFRKLYKFNANKISVVPSGCRIHNEQYLNKLTTKDEYEIPADKILIFFHGSFSHPPNREAFKTIEENIAPRFESFSNILFVIGGSGLEVFEHNNVKSIGFIENLNATIQIMDIAIVPLKTGGGTKLKIFDYFSNGIPIITTKKGAEGIEIENGIHALITDDSDEKFIEAIKYLVTQKTECIRLAIAAKNLAENKYDWEKIGENLNKQYLELVGINYDD